MIVVSDSKLSYVSLIFKITIIMSLILNIAVFDMGIASEDSTRHYQRLLLHLHASAKRRKTLYSH